MNKTAFVKSLPPDMPAKEVVERAKKAGITISDKYVYVVRSNLRRRTGKGKRRGPGRPAGVTQSTAATGTPSEREFRRLALQIGVQRAEQLLTDTKKRVQQIIAGE